MKIKSIFFDRRGATAIEYALIAVLVSVAATLIISNVGTHTQSKYEEVNTAVANANER